MDLNLNPAYTFGTLLRKDRKAAQFYDNCTPEQREAILLQLQSVQDMETFVQQLPHSAP